MAILRMTEPLKCELISWQTVLNLSYRLAEKIQNSGFKPDIIIAIARGGFVPARLLCDHLDIYNLTSMRIEHYQAGSQKMPSARLSIPLSVDVKNKNVLVVDDVDDTGETIKLAIEHVRSFSPADIKLAVIHYKTTSPLAPDFFGGSIRNWRWLIYPWAVTEDIGNFISRLPSQPESVEQANHQLLEHFGIRVPINNLRHILELSQALDSEYQGN
jgi:hypoxanthine phosphoribosyltransferase